MNNEKAIGIDMAQISALIPMVEKANWHFKATIHKFVDPNDEIAALSKKGMTALELLEKFKDRFIGLKEFEGNLLLNEGINNMWTLICGGSATAYNNANARIGVGNSSTGADAVQTALLGGSTAFKAMDGGYPTFGTSQKATFKSTYGSADGNFAWEEITVDNGSGPNLNLNRKVQSMGTKASGTTWVATLEITIT